MSGGGGSTTTQKADPWSGEQPALSAMYGNLTGAYNSGQLAPNQNTGQVAGMPPQLDALYRQIYNTGINGTQGDATLNGAIGQTQQLAGGNFSNLQGANTLQQFSNGNWAADPLSNTLANVANGTAGNNVGAFSDLNNMSKGNFSGTPQGTTLTNFAAGNFSNSPAAQQLSALSAGNYGTGVYGVLNGMASGNFNGTGLDQLVKTSNGAYTDPNNNAATMLFNAQAQPLTKQFQQSTLPGLLSAYSAAGRYGSGANDAAIGAASDSLGQTLGNLSQSTIGQNYLNERQNQLGAAGQLAGLQSGAATNLAGMRQNASNTLLGAQGSAASGLLSTQAGAANNMAGIQAQLAQYLTSLRSGSAGTLAGIQGSAISALPGMGAQQNTNTWNNLSNAQTAMAAFQQQQQAQLDAQAKQYNYDQSQPLTGLSNLSGLLQNGAVLNGKTTTTDAGGSTLKSVGGGALAGATTGMAIGGPWGAAIGGVAGGLLGVL
jgi:hypothetical protein